MQSFKETRVCIKISQAKHWSVPLQHGIKWAEQVAAPILISSTNSAAAWEVVGVCVCVFLSKRVDCMQWHAPAGRVCRAKRRDLFRPARVGQTGWLGWLVGWSMCPAAFAACCSTSAGCILNNAARERREHIHKRTAGIADCIYQLGFGSEEKNSTGRTPPVLN